MHNYIVFDVETGGLDYKVNPITQIAMVVLDGTTLQELEAYSTYIKPYDSTHVYEPKALTYTGITMDMLNNKGEHHDTIFQHLVTLFKKYKAPGGRPGNSKYYPCLVGHNASEFDRKFLWKFFKSHNCDLYDYVREYIEDTQLETQKAVPTLASVKLSNCCEHFGITLEGAHDALNDTRATAQLFRVLCQKLRGEGVVQSSQEVAYSRSMKFQF